MYYRYPHGTEVLSEDDNLVEETGVDWVPFTEDDLKGLVARVQSARNGMRKSKFDPKPSPDNCKYCDFLSVCGARASQKEINASNRKKKKRPEEMKSHEGGFTDFSM